MVVVVVVVYGFYYFIWVFHLQEMWWVQRIDVYTETLPAEYVT